MELQVATPAPPPGAAMAVDDAGGGAPPQAVAAPAFPNEREREREHEDESASADAAGMSPTGARESVAVLLVAAVTEDYELERRVTSMHQLIHLLITQASARVSCCALGVPALLAILDSNAPAGTGSAPEAFEEPYRAVLRVELRARAAQALQLIFSSCAGAGDAARLLSCMGEIELEHNMARRLLTARSLLRCINDVLNAAADVHLHADGDATSLLSRGFQWPALTPAEAMQCAASSLSSLLFLGLVKPAELLALDGSSTTLALAVTFEANLVAAGVDSCAGAALELLANLACDGDDGRPVVRRLIASGLFSIASIKVLIASRHEPVALRAAAVVANVTDEDSEADDGHALEAELAQAGVVSVLLEAAEEAGDAETRARCVAAVANVSRAVVELSTADVACLCAALDVGNSTPAGAREAARALWTVIQAVPDIDSSRLGNANVMSEAALASGALSGLRSLVSEGADARACALGALAAIVESASNVTPSHASVCADLAITGAAYSVTLLRGSLEQDSMIGIQDSVAQIHNSLRILLALASADSGAGRVEPPLGRPAAVLDKGAELTVAACVTSLTDGEVIGAVGASAAAEDAFALAVRMCSLHLAQLPRVGLAHPLTLELTPACAALLGALTRVYSSLAGMDSDDPPGFLFEHAAVSAVTSFAIAVNEATGGMSVADTRTVLALSIAPSERAARRPQLPFRKEGQASTHRYLLANECVRLVDSGTLSTMLDSVRVPHERDRESSYLEALNGISGCAFHVPSCRARVLLAAPDLLAFLNEGSYELAALAADCLAPLVLQHTDNRHKLLAVPVALPPQPLAWVPNVIDVALLLLRSALGQFDATGRKDDEVVSAAVSAGALLRNLCWDEPSIQAQVDRKGAIPALLDLARLSDPRAQATAAACLRTLCRTNDARRDIIARMGGAAVLVAIVHVGTNTASPGFRLRTRAQQEAAAALGNFMLGSLRRQVLVATSTAPADLVAMLQSAVPKSVELALGALAALAWHNGRASNVLVQAGVIELLPALMTADRTRREQVGAATLARNLAWRNMAGKQRMAKVGVVQLLAALTVESIGGLADDTGVENDELAKYSIGGLRCFTYDLSLYPESVRNGISQPRFLRAVENLAVRSPNIETRTKACTVLRGVLRLNAGLARDLLCGTAGATLRTHAVGKIVDTEKLPEPGQKHESVCLLLCALLSAPQLRSHPQVQSAVPSLLQLCRKIQSAPVPAGWAAACVVLLGRKDVLASADYLPTVARDALTSDDPEFLKLAPIGATKRDWLLAQCAGLAAWVLRGSSDGTVDEAGALNAFASITARKSTIGAAGSKGTRRSRPRTGGAGIAVSTGHRGHSSESATSEVSPRTPGGAGRPPRPDAGTTGSHVRVHVQGTSSTESGAWTPRRSGTLYAWDSPSTVTVAGAESWPSAGTEFYSPYAGWSEDGASFADGDSDHHDPGYDSASSDWDSLTTDTTGSFDRGGTPDAGGAGAVPAGAAYGTPRRSRHAGAHGGTGAGAYGHAGAGGEYEHDSFRYRAHAFAITEDAEDGVDDEQRADSDGAASAHYDGAAAPAGSGPPEGARSREAPRRRRRTHHRRSPIGEAEAKTAGDDRVEISIHAALARAAVTDSPHVQARGVPPAPPPSPSPSLSHSTDSN